jgi:rod shape-determining protein MreC
MIAARVIGTATGASASAVFVDRGSAAGVEKGMAVVTPDGIVGKVLAAYPFTSQVLLATDPTFAAGVVSQKNHVRGILKGLGHGNCRVDYLQNEEKVDTGEWFYTSGDDRIFPKGLPAGQVIAARPGNPFQDVTVDPSGLAGGLEEVLIVLQGVHQDIPELKTAAAPVYLAPPPPAEPLLNQGQAGPSPATSPPAPSHAPALTTDADKVREHYQEVGAAQGHKFGENLPGSKPADFNFQVKPGDALAVTAKPGVEGEKRIAGDQGTAAPGLPASPRPRLPAEPKAAVSRPKTLLPSKPAPPPQ